MTEQIIKLADLPAEDVPADLRAGTYFDFDAHPFAHRELFERTHSVCGAIAAIHDYAAEWLETRIGERRAADTDLDGSTAGVPVHLGEFRVMLGEGAVFRPARVIGAGDGPVHTVCLAPGARLVGADLYLQKGDVFIGENTTVEPSAGIGGPSIVGAGTTIRQGAYLRGDCIIGDGAVIRGEIKNSVLMDKAEFPHHSYQGDSLCGYRSHFGAGASTANIGIFAGMKASAEQRSIVVRCGGKAYDLGTRKMGICMGDFSQVGCNSVSDPATFLKPRTVTYPLTRISKGFYGPDEILKNKPLEHGIIERTPLR